MFNHQNIIERLRVLVFPLWIYDCRLNLWLNLCPEQQPASSNVPQTSPGHEFFWPSVQNYSVFHSYKRVEWSGFSIRWFPEAYVMTKKWTQEWMIKVDIQINVIQAAFLAGSCELGVLRLVNGIPHVLSFVYIRVNQADGINDIYWKENDRF